MSTFPLPPDAVDYLDDDADRNRATFAFSDLRSALAPYRAGAEWEIKLYRSTSSFDDIKAYYQLQLEPLGFALLTQLGNSAPGYQRVAWMSQTQALAVAYFQGEIKPSVVIVLTQKAKR